MFISDCIRRENFVPMDNSRCVNAKSLRAAGTQPVNNEKTARTELEGAQQPGPLASLGGASTFTTMVRGNGRRKKIGRDGKSASRDDDNLHPVSLGFSELPPIYPQRIYERKVYWRFAANGFATTAFTLADGCNQFLVTTNTTGNLVAYADSWRLKKLDVYMKDSSSDEQVLITFTPNSVTTDNFLDELPRSFSMTSAGFSRFVHYQIATHPRHPIGSWHKCTTTNQAGTLFSMSASGNMKDYCAWLVGTFEFVPNLVGTVPGYGISGAGTTVSGEFYTHSIMGAGLVSIGQNSLT